MAENITDLNKLKESMTFMAVASKNYRDKVRAQQIRKAALESEGQEIITPSSNLNGDTSPFSKT